MRIEKFISGGNFGDEPEASLIADGYEARQSGDTWEVVPTN